MIGALLLVLSATALVGALVVTGVLPHTMVRNEQIEITDIEEWTAGRGSDL
jgi:hypothetical protein